MLKLRKLIVIVFVLAALVIHTGSAAAQQIQAASITMLSPSACPFNGCAAGQRINFEVSFTISPAFSGQNTQICLSSSDGSSASGSQALFSFDGSSFSNEGLITGLPYTSGTCSQVPSGEIPVAAFYSAHTASSAEDFNFALRLDSLANQSGSLYFHLYQKDIAGNWVETDTSSHAVSVISAQTTIGYVAENADNCGMFSPCYVNSGDDLPLGFGTGLKDAIDALTPPANINIISTYTIGENTVLIDKVHTIKGFANGQISTASNFCSSPMLAITSPATIQDLVIDDGNCGSVSRTLLLINNPDSNNPTVVQRNTLTDGRLGIYYADSLGDLIVRFNHFENNSAYAIYRPAGTNAGELSAIGNNFVANNPFGSLQVDCAGKGLADHNFWGAGITPSAASINCTVSNDKRLGAAAQLANAGVEGALVTVGTGSTPLFGGDLRVKHNTGTADYPLYVINHGSPGLNNIPFYSLTIRRLTACGDYYDIFLGSSVSNGTDLQVSFNYSRNSECALMIESSVYCGKATPDDYPLWWFNPKDPAQTQWLPVQRQGASVSCDTSADVVTMTLTTSTANHPNLSSDLNFTPFVLGIPRGIWLSDPGFTAKYTINQAALTWKTLHENEVSGFYILRSDSTSGTYTRLYPIVTAVGDLTVGGMYEFVDNTVQFARNYYYKLEVIGDDGNSLDQYGPALIATATTPTLTLTPTVTPTFPTLTFTPTRTPTLTYTPYFYRSPTPIVNRTVPPVIRTSTASFQTATSIVTGTPLALTQTAQALASPTLVFDTLTPTLTPTETLTPSPTYTVTLTPTPTPPQIGGGWLDKSDRYSSDNLWGLLLGALAAGLITLLTGLLVRKKP